MKYLAQITPEGKANNGCYCFDSDSLDDIRAWAKRIGKPGDELLIQPNGKNGTHSRTFTL